MKKKIIMRGLFGLPTGIAIGFVITLIISICIGNGSFYPVTPELIDATGNELNAVILQTVLCAIMGAGFAAASIIWELDSWSLAKQSGIYFMIISVIMPVCSQRKIRWNIYGQSTTVTAVPLPVGCAPCP